MSFSGSINPHFTNSTIALLANTTLPSFSNTTPAAPTTNTPDIELEAAARRQLIICIILGIFSVFGTFGNGLVLYVFTRKNDKMTSTIFILALAWTDFVTCLVIVPYTIVFIQTQALLLYDVVCKAYLFLITCNVPLSAFIMVAIAVDRYFSICHPFLHVITPRRARISIMCLCAFAFTLGTITACMYGVYNKQQKEHTVSAGDASWCPNTTSFATDRPEPSRLPISLQDSTVPAQPGLSMTYSQSVEVLVIDKRIDHTWPPENCTRNISAIVYTGMCAEDGILFSTDTVAIFSQIQASFFAISLLLVFALYFLIYRSIIQRRAWRRRQKSWSHVPMTQTPQTKITTVQETPNDVKKPDELHEAIEMVNKNGDANEVHNNDKGNDVKPQQTSSSLLENNTNDQLSSSNETNSNIKSNTGNGNRQNSTRVLSAAEKKVSRERKDFNFLANIRTAGMLFVVTIVFIVSFLPAWLMAIRILQYHEVVFYMYFVYNTANPVIYAFMNQSFRKELKRVFQRGTHFFRTG